MNQITAIIRPHRLEAVEEALHALEHLPGFTIFPARGYPRGHGPHHAYTAEWSPDSHNYLVLLMFCPDELTSVVIDAIRGAAHTGHPGDGVIGVTVLEDVVRIRTDERGDAAI